LCRRGCFRLDRRECAEKAIDVFGNPNELAQLETQFERDLAGCDAPCRMPDT